MPPVNLDYAASTPMRPEAIAAQSAYDASDIAGANPNALHTLGRRAAARLERARADIASCLGARVRPSELVLTAGGTEANQLALLGIAEGVRARDRKRTRVIVSGIEHDSILDNLGLLHEAGFETDIVAPARSGRVEPDGLARLLDDRVALASIMLANNETGVIQPVRELAELTHRVGARFHTDAIQGFLHIPIDVDELGCDALSLAGHKVGGPVATGGLYLRGRTPLRPRLLGGGQEAGRRAGTQDVRSHVALAAVCRALAPRIVEHASRVRALSDKVYRQLASCPRIRSSVPDVERAQRLPGIVSVLVQGIESEDLILRLDAAGFEVSAGSACSAGAVGSSHVLRAMGIDEQAASGSLRISFDDRAREADLDRFCRALCELAAAGPRS
ncbi:Cysteine desulfurase [Coriobacterium glomerans PW2]|uniref:Cysteine desulfurase n=1 Tax=Coriobacterium glomerans (strain ATCC 49209 / DSM 20642 / JCM 10262 / PW2) TaxID=700015 RepID=F2N9J5_CORGP|nr:cysteine desulfurase family protein [Coriobacterium glomerans]AEB07024.1 Cysteine desulfurase [Coriobacterium glomerans PW2]